MKKDYDVSLKQINLHSNEIERIQVDLFYYIYIYIYIYMIGIEKK